MLKAADSPKITISTADQSAADLLHPGYIKSLTPCGEVTIGFIGKAYATVSAAVNLVKESYEAHLVVAGIIDLDAEVIKPDAAAEVKLIIVAAYDCKMQADG